MKNIKKLDRRIASTSKQRVICEKINEVVDTINSEKYWIIVDTSMAGIDLYDTYREAIENLQYKWQTIFRVREAK